MVSLKLERNDPCSCGSGKEYKNCCLGKAEFHPQYSSAPTPDELNLLGALFNTGRYVELESLARSLLRLYPDFGVVWKQFGLSLQMQGKDALPALQQAAELLPNDAEAHGNLAAALRARGQLDAAVANRRRALQIRPDFAEAHNNLGLARKELGQFDGALASCRRAIEIKPDFANAHSNLGKVLRELGQLEGEMESYRLALEIDPECCEALLGLGHLCMENGVMDRAEALFQKVLEIEADNLAARFDLAQARKMKVDDENFAALMAMEVAARNGVSPIPNKKAILLHFALGKCYVRHFEHKHTHEPYVGVKIYSHLCPPFRAIFNEVPAFKAGTLATLILNGYPGLG